MSISAEQAVTIRHATGADRPALIALKLQMNRHEHDQLPEESPIRAVLDLSPEAAARGVAWYFDEVARSGGNMFVAEEAGVVVGSILWHRFEASEAFTDAARTMAMICGVVVAPALQGRGLGRRLIQHVEADIRAAGIAHAMLQVTYDNQAASRLYDAAGYLPLEVTRVKPL